MKIKKSLIRFGTKDFVVPPKLLKNQPLSYDAVKRIGLSAPKVDTKLSHVGSHHPDSL